MKLILKGQKGFNLTNVYKSFGKGKFKKGEYYDTNGRQITRNGILLESVYRELRNRHDKDYVDTIASNIKAGNIYQNGRWRANVGDTAKVASEAEAIAQAKKDTQHYRQGLYGRWQYKTSDGQWNYFNGSPKPKNPPIDKSKIRTSNRSQTMDRGTVYPQYYSINNPTNLVNSGDYAITNNTNKDLRFTKVLKDTSGTPIAFMDNKGDWYTTYGDNNNFSYKTNNNWIGKYTAQYDKSRALSQDGQFKSSYYTHSGNLVEYHPLSNLPSSPDIQADNNGILYLNNTPYGFLVRNGDTTGYYTFKTNSEDSNIPLKERYKNTIQDNNITQNKHGGTMKLISKAKNGLSFKEAFNKARNNGDRIFWYKGRTYNTMNSKEKSDSKLRKQWAQTHKDNSTSGGSRSVQTDVGLSGGWIGVKGANAGRFDSNGNWVHLTEHSDAPVAARGDNVTQHLDYAPIDKPTDSKYTYVAPGTDRGKGTSNLTTGITVGMPNMVHKFQEVEPNSFADNREYGGNQDITQFSPWGFPGGPGTYVVSPITPGYSFKNNQPQEQTDNSTGYAPTTVSFESITPEQVSAFAKSLGLKNYSIAGNKEITVTAKAKGKVKPFVENQ